MHQFRIEAIIPIFLPINPSGVAYPKSLDVYTLFVTNFSKWYNPLRSGQGCVVANFRFNDRGLPLPLV